MINREQIPEFLPEASGIMNRGLYENAANAFLEALSLGGWTSLKELSETPILPDSARAVRPFGQAHQRSALAGKSDDGNAIASGREKLMPGRLEFLSEVIALCNDMVDCVGDWILELAPLNRDTLLIAAFLSDIGNYVTQGPSPVSEAHMYNKAEWAAYIAMKNGLPPAVVQILLTLDPRNAPEGARAIFTNEGRFVRSSYYTILAALM